MSESAILWLFGTVIGVQLVVIGALARALWAHLNDCKNVNAMLATIAGDIERIKDDLGDHDTGMRGDLHQYGKDLQYQGGCIWLLAEKAGLVLPPPEKRR